MDQLSPGSVMPDGSVARAWREQTSAAFPRGVLPGGHFFVRTAGPALLETVRTALAPSP